MMRFLSNKRFSPIGIDVSERSVRLVQLDLEHARVVEAVRWDMTTDPLGEHGPGVDQLADALHRGREGRAFRGRDAVMCLNGDRLFVQNVRVPKASEEELVRMIYQEAAGRIPYAVDEAELRYLPTGDVRQGDRTMREVVLFAGHRPQIETLVQAAIRAGFRPRAVDIEPVAVMRCYTRQYRRDQDRDLQAMFVHVGERRTAVSISDGMKLMFVKYLDIGGHQMDAAVAANLDFELADAVSLRKHHGHRRGEEQDDVTRSVNEAVMPVVTRLVEEVSMCLRYHSVAFRRKQVSRLIIGGSEANRSLMDAVAQKLDVQCDLGDPLRDYAHRQVAGRSVQWDVATGLALRGVN